MATVPTLTVGGIDQTAIVQNKTLYMRLKSLDFTLIDPVTTPSLHDAVTVDEPEWHGRVSTVESHPFRAASGDDHRYVQVTCTNKHEGDIDVAPFGISDDPDYATTFPFKDLAVIRTLADQTDLASAELRVTGTVYEPGLLPGMLLQVTSDAESLSAEEVYIVEISVNWLRDDSPEFHLEMSDTNTPPPTLGGVITDATCDCAPFVPCPPADYSVKSDNNAEVMGVTFPHGQGQTQTSDPGVANSDAMYLYMGATYQLDYEVHHGPTAEALQASIAAIGGGSLGATRVAMGWHADHMYCHSGYAPNYIEFATINYTMGYHDVGDPSGGYVLACLKEANCSGTDSVGSQNSVHITWLSGPDPRFTDLDPCEGTPHPGQPILPEDFTGDGSTDTFTLEWPYMPGSLVVLVEGVDWSDQVTETDATAGDFSLAYPPPLASDGEPNIEVHYRYPR